MHSVRMKLLLVSAFALAACGPSASVRKTTPVANLQSYQVALVRVASAPGLERFGPVLEFATSDSMGGQCSFTQIVGPTQIGQQRPDLIVDLNIRQSRRGGDGFIKNPNLATVDVTMVLSDGIDESLLGSAEISGKSSSVAVQGQDPENEALIAVGKRVAAILSKSGCFGQRIARATPPAPAPTEPAAPAPGEPVITPEQKAQAEALNDEGKRLFRSAEIAAAKAQFLQAVNIVRDPRFFFNLCLAHEALSELDLAVRACQAVLKASPEPRLAEKSNQRLQIISEKNGA